MAFLVWKKIIALFTIKMRKNPEDLENLSFIRQAYFGES